MGNYSTRLLQALNSFDGFKGAAMPTDPTNEDEYNALVNAVDGGSIYSGVKPTWTQIADKMAELKVIDDQKVADKASANAKLKALGLTTSEVEAFHIKSHTALDV